MRAMLALLFVPAWVCAATPPVPPVELTAEQDHQRLIELLHIKEPPPGAAARDPSAPNAANYNESKANPYPTLPDPLKFDNGREVRTARDWARRRHEITEAFDREVYGRVPPHAPAVKWHVTS